MELIILQCLAALFMFLSIIRPLLRGLWKLPGLAVCPLLALGIITGIFPAYGFRPECIPLLLFAIFLFIANLSDFLALFSGLQGDSYRDKGLLFTLGSAAAFAFAVWITVNFAPPVDTDLSTQGVKTIFLSDGKLHLRIYGQTEQTDTMQDRPLLILLPPVAGSFTVCDDVCAALRDRGFTVLACSRLNFDSPSFDQNGNPVRLFIPGLFRLGNALMRGLSDTAANAGGRKLEEGRKQDTLFLLHELTVNKTLHSLLGNTDKNMIFLAGYGAGGAALTVLSGQENFTANFPQVQGIISIEAPILSSLEGDPLPEPPPLSPNPITAFQQQIEKYAESLTPRKITHITEIPRPMTPVLFILSDRVIQERNGRYETILRSLASSRNTALLAAVPGAGPFDYSGSPRQYPVFSFLFRGAKQTEKIHPWPELTASLIANFAAVVLDSDSSAVGFPLQIPLVKTALDNNIYLEQGGVWNIPDVRTILQP